MRRLLFAVACMLSLMSVPLGRSVQAASTTTSAPLAHVFVELKGSPVAADLNLRTRDGRFRSHLKFNPFLPASVLYGSRLVGYQNQEIAYLEARGIHLRVNYRYHVVFNGFSAWVPQDQLNRLQRLANVVSVAPVRRVVPELDQSVKLINADKVWDSLGGPANAGKNVYIADIDTGIDMNNPCFRDAGFAPPSIGKESSADQNAHLTNNKVVRIRAFGTYQGQPYPADDTVGHGTFTASVEACDAGTVTPLGAKIAGVAPGAYLMSYNIQPGGDDGQGQQDPSLAAFEAAAEDGADVINYSYGDIFGAGDETEDPAVAALNTIVRSGIPVVVAAGNGGPTPESVSSPSTADDVIAVGASTNSRAYTSTVQVSGTGVSSSLQLLPSRMGSHGFDSVVGPAQVVYVGLGRMPKDDSTDPTANDFAGKDLKGKIALIQRGSIFFETKINNAAKAGAIAALIFDNQSSLDPIGMDTGTATLPAMSIRQGDGQALLQQIQTHPDTLVAFHPEKHVLPITPDVLSDFSARGYGPDYRIKPDLVAPGQDIYAATERGNTSGEMYDSSGFTMSDGTSFSAPHVTGAVALILQQHNYTPADIKAVLAETANTTALTDPGSTSGNVMDTGGGLLDVQAAMNAKADVLPSSLSFGQVNVGYGAQSADDTLNLADLNGGSGTWAVTLQQLHGASGLSVTVPSSVQLASPGKSTLAVHLSAASTVPSGDYDGYIWLKNGSLSLHVPYFVHVATQAVTKNSVLLVDATTSRFVLTPTAPPSRTKDISSYYESALDAIHRPYTYWNIAEQGSPSVADMQRSSGVIYFTGADLNGFGSVNSDFQSLFGPLSSIDMMNMHQYLNGGGRVFVTGPGAGLSDPNWTLFVLGANIASLSVYDNSRNDHSATGGMSPPRPSAVVDRRADNSENSWFFSGLKAIDLSTHGDGSGTNVAVNSRATPSIFGESLVGVTSLTPFSGTYAGYGSAYGTAILRTSALNNAIGGADVATASSDEPTLKHAAKYRGRAVYFSFDFAGINDNTGYATRAQVLQRIFSWFDDTPTARVTQTRYATGRSVQLRASLHSTVGSKVVQYQWQVGSKSLKATARASTYRFPRAGTYRIRALLTDSLGHRVLTAWARATVR